MSDDIVTRLRESNGMTTSRASDGIMSIHPDTNLMREAADEIERLRKEESETFIHYRKTIAELNEIEADRDRWREIAKCLNSDDANVRNLGYELYEQAARGE